MGRKNNNAGQPNRSAQIERRANRRQVNDRYKDRPREVSVEKPKRASA